MKKIIIILAGFIMANLAWMGFVRQPLPEIPEVRAILSEEVTFPFAINAMDYTGVELGLKEKVAGKGMYVQFRMANAWKTGRPGLVLTGIKETGGFGKGMSPQAYLKDDKREKPGGKDFSSFMKDNKGKEVTTYTFKQTLVEGDKGQMFMQMAYAGPPVEMLQTLEVPRPVTVPAHISQRFIPKGIIQFQPGTVAFDRKIQGFYIPVVVR